MESTYTGLSQVAHLSPTSRDGKWPAAVVFDFDGLLADTDACWRTAYEVCLRRRDQTLDRTTLRELAGASVATAAARLQVPRDELSEELATSFRESPIVTMPGAKTLVDALDGRIPIAVASNGPEQLVRYGLTRIGLAAAFDAVLSADRLANPKPAPDVYLAACVDPSDAVAIEDSKAGARAAAGAGMIVICVPTATSGRVEADLRAARLDDPVVMRYLGVDGAARRPDAAERR
jgi:HAD superfamily hydrolase (TIGR01509 family)